MNKGVGSPTKNSKTIRNSAIKPKTIRNLSNK